MPASGLSGEQGNELLAGWHDDDGGGSNMRNASISAVGYLDCSAVVSGEILVPGLRQVNKCPRRGWASENEQQQSEHPGERTVQAAASRRKSAAEKLRGNPSSMVLPRLQYGIQLLVLVCLFSVAVPLSIRSQRRFLTGEIPPFRGLEPGGWAFGGLHDLSDPQYTAFRASLFLLMSVALAHILVGRFLERKEDAGAGAGSGWQRQSLWSIAAGLLFLTYCFRSQILFFLWVAALNFYCKDLGVVATWGFNLFVLITSKYLGGYNFASVGAPFLDTALGTAVVPWQVCFNISLCRFISFNCDCIWAHRGRTAPAVTPHEVSSPADYSNNSNKNSSNNLQRRRVVEWMLVDRPTHSLDSDYSWLMYWTYVTYIPLFIGGPVLSYNAFAQQWTMPRTAWKAATRLHWKRIGGLCLEWLFWLAVLELLTQVFYYNGINDLELYRRTDVYPTGTWSPWEVAWGGWFTLNFMWMKFFVIWRFFRLWGILDGVDSPENMEKWINNNNTFRGFWRGWHSSLNLWIVRYVYLPLGGRHSQRWSIWVIFSFIAVWHDLWWRWVAWAWLNALFFVVEAWVLTVLASAGSVQRHRSSAWYEWAKYLLSGMNIVLLMVSNLAIAHGFAGTWAFLRHSLLDSRDGWWVSLLAVATMSLFASFQHLYAAWGEARKESPTL